MGKISSRSVRSKLWSETTEFTSVYARDSRNKRKDKMKGDIMKNFIYLLILLLLTGCATTYSKHSYEGGYSEMKIQEHLFKVTFEGNMYTSSRQTEDFGLLRCADVTLEKGYNYFIIREQVEREKGGGFTTIDFTIECFKEEPVKVLGIIYDAEQVRTNMKSQYKLK